MRLSLMALATLLPAAATASVALGADEAAGGSRNPALHAPVGVDARIADAPGMSAADRPVAESTVPMHGRPLHAATGHAGGAAAGAATLGDIAISGAVARASIGSAPTSAAYMTIATAGAVDRLVAAASPAAQAVELHASVQEGGVSKMRRVEAVPVAPDAPAELAPGGHHIMLIGLVAPLEDGTAVPLTLTFEKAGEVTLDVPVSRDVAGHGH